MLTKLEIPACSKSEALFAYLILASIELLCGKLETAGGYIESALAIARRLEGHAETLPPRIGKFACLVCQFDGDVQEVLPLPIIEDTLILPELNLNDVIRKICLTVPGVVSIKDVAISYFQLHFNISNLIAALDKAATASNNEKAIDILSGVIKESLGRKNELSDPVEMVADYFSLARNLIKKGNVTLTSIALAKADKMLKEYDMSGKEFSGNQRKRLRALKSELRIIAGALD